MTMPLTPEEAATLARLQAKRDEHARRIANDVDVWVDSWFFYNIQRGEIAQQLRENAAEVIELLRPFVEDK